MLLLSNSNTGGNEGLLRGQQLSSWRRISPRWDKNKWERLCYCRQEVAYEKNWEKAFFQVESNDVLPETVIHNERWTRMGCMANEVNSERTLDVKNMKGLKLQYWKRHKI